MSRKTTDQVTTIGINIGKNTFHLIGLHGAGNIVLRRKLSRSHLRCRSRRARLNAEARDFRGGGDTREFRAVAIMGRIVPGRRPIIHFPAKGKNVRLRPVGSLGEPNLSRSKDEAVL